MERLLHRAGPAVPIFGSPSLKGPGLAHYLGGPFEDRTGGLITFDADDAAQAQCAVRGDPFVLEGLVEAHWLKEWTPASA